MGTAVLHFVAGTVGSPDVFLVLTRLSGVLSIQLLQAPRQSNNSIRSRPNQATQIRPQKRNRSGQPGLP
jgi:hypothetical protein